MTHSLTDWKRPLARVARHEAAHAVIGEVFGLSTRRIRISKKRGDLTLPGYRWHVGGYVESDRRMTCGPLRAAIVWIAGSVAEQFWHGEPRSYINRGDLPAVLWMRFRKPELADLVSMTREHVWRHRRAILAVSKRLMLGDIEGAEVRRIMNRHGSRPVREERDRRGGGR